MYFQFPSIKVKLKSLFAILQRFPHQYKNILVLSLIFAQVWRHFITETDDRRWTEGKRKAEKDALVGISFLTTIQVCVRSVTKNGNSSSSAMKINSSLFLPLYFSGSINFVWDRVLDWTQPWPVWRRHGQPRHRGQGSVLCGRGPGWQIQKLNQEGLSGVKKFLYCWSEH